MVKKQAQIARIQTLADNSIRVTIDLINGNANDMAELYRLKMEETTMLIAPTEHFNAIRDEGRDEELNP